MYGYDIDVNMADMLLSEHEILDRVFLEEISEDSDEVDFEEYVKESEVSDLW